MSSGASSREDFERCERFEQATAERASTTVTQIDLGTLYLNRDLPKVWDRNFLWLGPGAAGVDASELAGVTDCLLGEAGVDHRKFLAAAEHVSPEVAKELTDLGWSRTDLITMTLRDASQAARSPDVEELSAHDYEDFNRTIIREFSDGGPDVVEQLVRLGTLMGRAGNARFFVTKHEGKYVSGSHLYSDGRAAQIEDVGTLEAYRGRGLAKVLMRHVIAEAFDAGHDLIFLVAEADDWPKAFYERLGFEMAGLTIEYKIEPPDTS